MYCGPMNPGQGHIESSTCNIVFFFLYWLPKQQFLDHDTQAAQAKAKGIWKWKEGGMTQWPGSADPQMQ